MRVLSLLEARELAPLRRAAPDSWIVRPINLAQARAELAGKPGGVYLFNPDDIATDALQAFAAASTGTGARIVLYGAGSLSARALVDLVTNAHVEVVSPTAEGGAVAITSVLALPDRSVPVRMLRAIGAHLLMLPADCAIAACRLFTFAPLPPSAPAFNARVGRTQVTVGRYLRSAGLCGPLKLLTIARVALAVHLSVARTATPESVAERCGFASGDAMASAFRELLNTSYREAMERWGPSEVALRLARAACRD